MFDLCVMSLSFTVVSDLTVMKKSFVISHVKLLNHLVINLSTAAKLATCYNRFHYPLFEMRGQKDKEAMGTDGADASNRQ